MHKITNNGRDLCNSSRICLSPKGYSYIYQADNLQTQKGGYSYGYRKSN